MAAIQNFKNFLRHGKQARAAGPPHGEATTNISPVHAQQQRYNNHGVPEDHQYALSDPNVFDHKPLQANATHGDYSVAVVDNKNVAAKAGDAAARAAGEHQEAQANQKAGSTDRKAEYDPSVLERIIADERESKGKLPKYPGLERWTLVEKMGDGAFSNVYRARDNANQYPDVAIKVVRKFEMNSSQVSLYNGRISVHLPIEFFHLPPSLVSLSNTSWTCLWDFGQREPGVGR
jgi:serine/threonine-protein kinase RCK2